MADNEHEHEWRDTGFATVDDCVCGATKSADYVREPLDYAANAAIRRRRAIEVVKDIIKNHDIHPEEVFDGR